MRPESACYNDWHRACIFESMRNENAYRAPPNFPKPRDLFRMEPTPKGQLVALFEWFGELGFFCGRLFRAALTPPYEIREVIRQLDELGSRSLLLVALAGSATGIVISLETRDSLIQFGAEAALPAVIIMSILRETGPIITGLIVSGRVAAGIGAELASMKVTDQISAMEVSGVNPYKYLAATRVLACAVILPMLTLAADFCGILMGWIANTLADPISLRLFLDAGFKMSLSMIFSHRH
jgi:phospholipid/cholesterol/gamma-HCH transport system permease protein